MPQNLQNGVSVGTVLQQWKIAEYEQFQWNKNWYILMGVVGTLCILYGILSGNFLFVFIVLLVAIILFLQKNQTPPLVQFAITDEGVVVGSRFYQYSEFKDFHLIYKPPEVKTLFLETKTALRPTLRISLEDMNPLEVRSALLQFLPENTDATEEPLSDRAARNFRIQ